MNELTLAELEASQGLTRVTQCQENEERKRPINSNGNKHAYEVGKTTTRSPGSSDLFRVNLLTFYPPGPCSELDLHENSTRPFNRRVERDSESEP